MSNYIKPIPYLQILRFFLILKYHVTKNFVTNILICKSSHTILIFLLGDIPKIKSKDIKGLTDINKQPPEMLYYYARSLALNQFLFSILLATLFIFKN